MPACSAVCFLRGLSCKVVHASGGGGECLGQRLLNRDSPPDGQTEESLRCFLEGAMECGVPMWNGLDFGQLHSCGLMFIRVS